MKAILILLSLTSGTLAAREAKVTPLMSKDLTDFRGKEGLMITVVYQPGVSAPFIDTTLTDLSMCSRGPS